MIIVRCDNLKKYFPILRGALREKVGVVKAVDGVSLTIEKGTTFGIVGESGCGKTTLGKIILGIIRPDSGTLDMSAKKVQVIFQDPFSSLDPRMRVRDILKEGLILQKDKGEIDPDPAEALDLVKLPLSSLKKYPHQFSGGERQRIAIARAIMTRPEFIVCDEPVSNLDVTIQVQILDLLKMIREKFAITYLFISHDLRVMHYMADRVAVMYQGRIVEEDAASRIYRKASHPYTKKLLSSVLDIYPPQ